MGTAEQDGYSFDDVIWTDECLVQLKITKGFAAVKLVMPPNLNQSEYIHVHVHLDCSVKINYGIIIVNRPRHPVKVHVWAGISKRGRTGICIFLGSDGLISFL